ncbi:ABC transporter substrate-binding protein [Alicyclobacillus sp. SO9]|uniref:ABC transporter substrate-binding protein n=1 Tax=Alicyclobacillus sp. SO9 TaxID=2665646 RepID=UPI0018E7B26E|nr:extracellular solute-binding protein [Alicyclobacillus sp. SO9]QQE77957.1 extracellular solute-binding protein [Alicyclobacillus sp. SO9]
MTKLRGITWNHTRGYVPLVAASQRFSEVNPDIEIEWEKRSLQEFADYPLGKLVDKFDLLVIDHPWAGAAIRNGYLYDLNLCLPPEFMSNQKANSIGGSHESYNVDGKQCALAIDAAAPVASYRPDLLRRLGRSVPQTWDEVLELARHGAVLFPGIPIDSLMNFYMLCSSQGEDPFQQENVVISTETGVTGLEQLRELASFCPEIMYNFNPIKVYEAMAASEEFSYCPFAYGYSNYSRTGYCEHQLVFTNPVRLGNRSLRTTLGGTGIALSAQSPSKDLAAQFLQLVAGPDFQRTMYSEAGGQPGHRGAWTDDSVNRLTNNYFRNTLETLDGSFMRPRYAGYLHFQDHAGFIVQRYLKSGGPPAAVLEELNQLYRESRNSA